MAQPIKDIGRVTVEKLDESPMEDIGNLGQRSLRAVLLRLAWMNRPSLTLRYNSADDSLFVRVYGAKTYVQLVHEKSSEVFVGFDHDQDGAWPTTLMVAKASKAVPREVSHPSVASQFLGNEFFIMADSAMGVPDQDVEFHLEQGYADALRSAWDAMVLVLKTND